MGYGHGGDDFLGIGRSSEKSGGRLTGWKEKGEIKVWLHKKVEGVDPFWAAMSWNHPVPKVIEVTDKDTKDKSLIFISDRWHCHETEKINMKRKSRDADGERTHPPVVCPMCIFCEHIHELVLSEKLSLFEPLMRWQGDGKDAEVTVYAGGVFNMFGWDDVKGDADHRRTMKDLGIRLDESWKQSMLVRRQFLFAVVDDANPSEGMRFSFEADALGTKMQAAIVKEKRKHGKNPDRGDPGVNPYPFLWTFDEKGKFADKYDVTSMTEDEPSEAVLEAISIDKSEIEKEADRQLKLGNCWALKAELESHWISKSFPFPAHVFDKAEKAGLMVAPEDSKADALGDEDVIDGNAPTRPAPSGAAMTSTKKRDRSNVYEVGPAHEVWFENPTSDEKVKGKVVELTPPEETPGDADSFTATKDEIKQAQAVLKSWGAKEVGVVVQCDHCDDNKMTTLDVDCPTCGAQVDEDGKLLTRPCLHDKAHQVRVNGADEKKAICETCGTVHELADATPDLYGAARWTMVKRDETKPAANGVPPRRRRIGTEPTAGGTRGVPFDK